MKITTSVVAGLMAAGCVSFLGCASCACGEKKACSGTAPVCTSATESCPYGSWALYLPFETMNAGHLILEKDAAGNPQAKLLWRWSSPTPAQAVVEGSSFTVTRAFSKPKGSENNPKAWRALRVTGKVAGDVAACSFADVDGNGQPVSKPQTFTAKRNPPVGPAPDLAKVKYGAPINILAGSIADFELLEQGKESGWTLKDGVLSNRIARNAKGESLHKNGNLRTKRADFYDFNLQYDVRVLPGCNSGVYLRGIYEIQVLDSYGQPVDCHNMAAFYGRITPVCAAEKPAGEWQHVDVTLVDRHVTVILNGKKIIDNKPVEGITGGAMTPNEFIPGPLYIQGDHSDADFRNMVLKPVVK